MFPGQNNQNYSSHLGYTGYTGPPRQDSVPSNQTSSNNSQQQSFGPNQNPQNNFQQHFQNSNNNQQEFQQAYGANQYFPCRQYQQQYQNFPQQQPYNVGNFSAQVGQVSPHGALGSAGSSPASWNSPNHGGFNYTNRPSPHLTSCPYTNVPDSNKKELNPSNWTKPSDSDPVDELQKITKKLEEKGNGRPDSPTDQFIRDIVQSAGDSNTKTAQSIIPNTVQSTQTTQMNQSSFVSPLTQHQYTDACESSMFPSTFSSYSKSSPQQVPRDYNVQGNQVHSNLVHHHQTPPQYSARGISYPSQMPQSAQGLDQRLKNASQPSSSNQQHMHRSPGATLQQGPNFQGFRTSAVQSTTTQSLQPGNFSFGQTSPYSSSTTTHSLQPGNLSFGQTSPYTSSIHPNTSHVPSGQHSVQHEKVKETTRSRQPFSQYDFAQYHSSANPSQNIQNRNQVFPSAIPSSNQFNSNNLLQRARFPQSNRFADDVNRSQGRSRLHRNPRLPQQMNTVPAPARVPSLPRQRLPNPASMSRSNQQHRSAGLAAGQVFGRENVIRVKLREDSETQRQRKEAWRRAEEFLANMKRKKSTSVVKPSNSWDRPSLDKHLITASNAQTISGQELKIQRSLNPRGPEIKRERRNSDPSRSCVTVKQEKLNTSCDDLFTQRDYLSGLNLEISKVKVKQERRSPPPPLAAAREAPTVTDFVAGTGRAAPETPKLPPGVSIQKSSDTSKLANLSSSIQVQRTSNNATESNINRLAGLGIKISRSDSGDSGSANSAMSRLSGLGVSVSGGPSSSPAPKLPPGLSISGGPRASSPRLPSGISVSGGSAPPRLPPGINISGGGGGAPPPPSRPAGVIRQNVPRPQHNGGQAGGGLRSPAPGGQRPPAPANQFQPPHQMAPAGIRPHAGPRRGRPRKPSSSGPSPTQSPSQTPPPQAAAPSQSPSQQQQPLPSPGYPAQPPRYHPVPSPNYQPSPSPSPGAQPSPNMQPSPKNPQLSPGVSQPSPGFSVSSQQPGHLDVHTGQQVHHPPPGGEPQQQQQSPSQSQPPAVVSSSVSSSPGTQPTSASTVQPDQSEPADPVSQSSLAEEDTAEPPPESDPPPDGVENMEQDEVGDQSVSNQSNKSLDNQTQNTDAQSEMMSENPDQLSSESNADQPMEPVQNGDGMETDQSDAQTAEADQTAEKAAAGGGEGADAAGGEAEVEYAEGEEYWEGYEEGYEGYEGEEGDWEGYEGEEMEGYEGEEWTEEGGEGQTEEGEKDSGSKDSDGAPPQGEETEASAAGDSQEATQTETEAATVQQSTAVPPTEQQDTPAVTPTAAQTEPSSTQPPARSSSNSLPNLPPGISISNNAGPVLPPGISVVNTGNPQLPPGISISPFKKPSNARQSTDEDARSTNSYDRDNSIDRASDTSEGRSTGLDRTPRVGSETTCVVCLNRCIDRRPKLLSCLHSACGPCFYDKLAEARREDSGADVVDLDGDGIVAEPEVTCPVCRSTTSEAEAIENLLILGSDDAEDGGDDDSQICSSCEENAIATSKCTDCDEYLCSDCVRAHQRVKMTKDHQIVQMKGPGGSSQNYKICPTHPYERLTLYCESCDILNCRDCQLSERHRNCKYRYSYEVAPEVKSNLVKSSSDIRMKKSHIEESCGIISTKISEVNIKEKSLLTQLKEVKNFIISKVEDRYRELTTEVTKRTRDKRKILEARKNNLDRSFWQADYALAFIDFIVNGNVEDEKLLLSKKLVMRQLKRLKRVNQAVNLSPSEMEFKLDLYFQHYHGQSLHSNIDSIVKMTMSDIKVSAVPIEPPQKPKPPPPASPVQAQSPARPPGTPQRPNFQSPQGMGRGGPSNRGAMGGVVRQLATPTKSPVRTQAMKSMSPARQLMGQQQGGRGAQRVQMINSRGMPTVRGRGRAANLNNPQMMRGNQSMMRGNIQGVVKQGSLVMGSRGRSPMMPGTGRGAAGRGAVGMRGSAGRMRSPMVQQQSRRGRPALQSVIMSGPRYASQNQQYTNAALGLNKAQPKQQSRQRQIVPQQRYSHIQQQQQPQQQQFALNFQQQPQQAAPVRPKQSPMQSLPAGLSVQSVPASINHSSAPMNPSSASINHSSASSWHTPTTAPVSPPTMQETDFKIILPKMGGPPPPKVKQDTSPDIIDLDATVSKLPPHLNISRTGGSSDNLGGGGGGSVDLLLTGKPGMSISKIEEGVDPLGDIPDPLAVETSKPSAMVSPMVTLKNENLVKSERPQNRVEVPKEVSRAPTNSPRAVLEGSGAKERNDGDWCAVCHDGGDTLYCCDRCPKVYHLYCYIPPLEAEPADDWVCLMCETREEIFSLSTKVRKGRGNLSERDLKLCRRLLLEMFNLWPESVPFRDSADLKFPQYLEKIKEPIAMDVIKDRLMEDSPCQYSSVKMFLADLRKMFRNCFTFNPRETEIYKHAKKMEERLDALLEVWVPEFAHDPLINVAVKRPTSPKAGPSSKKKKALEEPEKKKRGRKKKKKDSDFETSDSEDMSEGERERQQYLAAIQQSAQDYDKNDHDFLPEDEEDDASPRAKGKGRGKGRR